MLVLTSIRPIGSDDMREVRKFNWDSEIPIERTRAAKLIFEAMERNNTVQSRKISYRNSRHSTVMQMRTEVEEITAAE